MVRAVVDAFNRGDVAAALKHTSPDFEIDNSTNRGDWRGVYRGPDEARDMFATLAEPWESVRFDVEEFTEVGDAVLTRPTIQFRGRDGIEVRAHIYWVWRFRAGAIAELHSLNERDEALEAVGLRE